MSLRVQWLHPQRNLRPPTRGVNLPGSVPLTVSTWSRANGGIRMRGWFLAGPPMICTTMSEPASIRRGLR